MLFRSELESGAAQSGDRTAVARLTSTIEAFVRYGVAHPAFADCAQSLMRRSGPELLDELSESALLRLGRAMSGCLAILTALFDQGNESGEFQVKEPALLANMLYASGLGALQLARVGILVTETSPGVPVVSTISADQVRDHLVSAALAQASRIATTP